MADNLNVALSALVFVEVTDDPISSARPYTDKNGAAKTIPPKQKIYVHQGDRYPVQSEIAVDEQRGPLRPGRYLLAGNIFSVGDYQRLKFNDRGLMLVPAEEALRSLVGPVAKAA